MQTCSFISYIQCRRRREREKKRERERESKVFRRKHYYGSILLLDSYEENLARNHLSHPPKFFLFELLFMTAEHTQDTF